MADMNMMVAMLRGAFAALTDEQKREVLGDGYAPQPDLASTLADVTLDEVLEHSDIDSEDLIEQLEAEGCWVYSDIEDMAQAVRDDGKVVFDEDDTDEVERWAKDNGYVFYLCKDEARRSLLNEDDDDKLVFDNASEAAQWVFENEDEVAVQGRSLASLAHQAGHKLFVDGEGIVEHVRGAMGKGVFDDDKAVLSYVTHVMGWHAFASAPEAANWVYEHHLQELISVARGQGHLLFEDQSEIIEYVSDTLGKVVVSRPYLRKLREDVRALIGGTLETLDMTLGSLLEDPYM